MSAGKDAGDIPKTLAALPAMRVGSGTEHMRWRRNLTQVIDAHMMLFPTTAAALLLGGVFLSIKETPRAVEAFNDWTHHRLEGGLDLKKALPEDALVGAQGLLTAISAALALTPAEGELRQQIQLLRQTDGMSVLELLETMRDLFDELDQVTGTKTPWSMVLLSVRTKVADSISVRFATATDWSQLLTIARDILTMSQLRSIMGGGPVSGGSQLTAIPAPAVAVVTTDLKKKKKKAFHKKKTNAYSDSKEPAEREGPSKPPPADRPCPRCLQTGHWARECPAPKPASRTVASAAVAQRINDSETDSD